MALRNINILDDILFEFSADCDYVCTVIIKRKKCLITLAVFMFFN